MSGGTDWLSAIGILLSGLVLGFMFIYGSRRKSSAAVAVAPDLDLIELEAKRDALIRQLREMEDEGEVNSAERRRVETAAAEVLRDIDVRKSARPARARAQSTGATTAAVVEAVPAAADGFFARRPALKGFLVGIASVAAIGGLFYFVYTSSTQREANGSMTGGNGMSARQTQTDSAPQQTDAALLQLQSAVQSNPDNVDARIELARAYLDRENLMGVYNETNAVLQKNPEEPRAQTYNAIVRMSMGQLADARKMLDSATKTDPKITDAWVAKAWIATQQGEGDAAAAAIKEAIRNHPEQEQRLKEVLTQMQTHATPVAGAPNVPGAQSGALPNGHPSIDGATAAEAPAAPPVDPKSAIHLTISVAGSKAPTGVLYIIARPEGQAGGPPVAVKRVPAGTFPLTLDLSSADSMMGQPLPAKIHIEARLDSDGNVMTKNAADPKALADNVAAGANLALTLK